MNLRYICVEVVYIHISYIRSMAKKKQKIEKRKKNHLYCKVVIERRFDDAIF